MSVYRVTHGRSSTCVSSMDREQDICPGHAPAPGVSDLYTYICSIENPSNYWVGFVPLRKKETIKNLFLNSVQVLDRVDIKSWILFRWWLLGIITSSARVYFHRENEFEGKEKRRHSSCVLMHTTMCSNDATRYIESVRSKRYLWASVETGNKIETSGYRQMFEYARRSIACPGWI